MNEGFGFLAQIQKWSGLDWIQLIFIILALCMLSFTLAHFGLFTKLSQKLFPHTSPLLVSCDVCLGKVSQNAHACPHCGEPFVRVSESGKPRRGY